MNMTSLFDVSGKVAVVSGGSSGIGAMMARGLLENGAKVYITARKAERLMAMAEELSQYGECIAIPADMSKVEGIEAFAAAVAERESQIDILINNAGANWSAPLEAFPEKGWDKVMDINIKSIFFAIQKFLPLLKASGTLDAPARVVNIASINGIRNSGMPTYAYSASKSGVIHLTEHLGAELAATGINVNAIAPGYFVTDINSGFLASDYGQAMKKRMPQRRWGEMQDLTGPLLLLASDASAYMTGACLEVDGGHLCSSL